MPREHGGGFICVGGHVSVDQQPFVKAIVSGSKQVSQDLSIGADAVLDPDGDLAYSTEIQRGGLRNIKMCSNSDHLGDGWLSRSEFTTDKDTADGLDCWCKTCRRNAAFLRRVREAEAEGRKLREKPGRPAKADGS